MAGDADEPRELLFARLEKVFQHAAGGLDARQVVFVFERVDVDEVHLVHFQILQTLLDDALDLGTVTSADLCGHEQPPRSPARLERLAVQLLAAAAGVAVGRVEVGDARPRRLHDEAHRFLVVAGLIKALAAAARQDGDALAGLPQWAHGKRALGARKRSGQSRHRGGALQKLAS